MITKLKTSGNGWELYFSKQLLKLLGYNPETIKLLITCESNSLIVEPIDENELKKYENNMIRKLQKSGGSGAGLYFPAALISVLNLNPETDMIDVEISGNKFSVKKHIE